MIPDFSSVEDTIHPLAGGLPAAAADAAPPREPLLARAAALESFSPAPPDWLLL